MDKMKTHTYDALGVVQSEDKEHFLNFFAFLTVDFLRGKISEKPLFGVGSTRTSLADLASFA